ncbi:MAG: glutamine-hydrolyzing GMP synthase, partial [Pirellulaceae bacterium]|nr:glutamine-hydrolyzing GMP synthase [Pirellulaceae bacterium]
MDVASQRILVLDFGSQYAQLIARRVREQSVYCEIVRHDISIENIQKHNPSGLILSGGPSSVSDFQAPTCDKRLFDLGLPVLGICYGMQLGCELLGGKVSSAPSREYGRAEVTVIEDKGLFKGVSSKTEVWMSHGDQVLSVGEHFKPIAKTATCPIAAVKHRSIPFWGVQFHPEVTHSQEGKTLLRNFLTEICGCQGTWQLDDFAENEIQKIREKVGDSRVICGLSGGVDSAVVAAL